MNKLLFTGMLGVLLAGCSDRAGTMFTRMEGSSTGLRFKNMLRESQEANVLNYAYFYNGGGVAAGDINNDGLPDLVFTGNMVPNRLYLNKGNLAFEDITAKSGIAQQQGWCTGATMADVNGDGLTDIYICRSADTDPLRRRNLLYINNGDLTFTERAVEYGLADEGYSTQAAFFDYDKDGDLDMALINHSLQEYANAAFENAALREQKEPAFATKLYRNDGGHFKDVSTEAGIVSNVLSFGLGLAVSDLNNDGWPDLYISNDFNEADHLYINNGNGTFSERLKDCMDECSLYSMGSDCADINNDGLVDLMTLDMLAEDNHTQKMHSGAENFDKFQMLFRQGSYYQYSRNMLQLNNGDGTFSEIGQLAGVSNTDWSWSALFSDLDNDGFKDLFVSNGYARDFTDMDFIKYHFSQARAGANAAAAMELLDRMPSLTPPDYLYHNNGNNTFTNKTVEWGLGERTISSGAVYADLDNDGDLDLVVSRVNDEAALYRNNAVRMEPSNGWLKVKLEGSAGNRWGIGAKIKLYCKGQLFYQEQQPVRGFQSSVDPVLNFGTGKALTADSVIVVWPDDRMQVLRSVGLRQTLVLKWKDADKIWHYTKKGEGTLLREVPGPAFVYRENPYNDLARQPLLLNYLSRPGPCMAKADVNHDGREDLFIGGARGQRSQVLLQTANGAFSEIAEPAIARDSLSEAASALFFDADGDGDMDLYIASGGYELSEGDGAMQDHLYLNDGLGHFTGSIASLPDMRWPKSCVRAADIDHDGDLDLFVGGRVVPGKYPFGPGCRVLQNDGKGRFRDNESLVKAALPSTQMVTDAAFADINGDGWADLLIVGEWMGIKVLVNHSGQLWDESSKYIQFASQGWWNSILAEDMDGDGDLDLVVGNLGLNAQFRASLEKPVTLDYDDFDRNGVPDPIFSYWIGAKCYPAVSRDDLVAQVPMLKKKFLEYHAYADVTVADIFPDRSKESPGVAAQCLTTLYLENRGAEGFVRKELPDEAQYGPVYAIAAADIDGDGRKDLVLAGNNGWTRIRFGRYKANHGVMLRGDGKGGFSYVPQWASGLHLRDDIRSVEVFGQGDRKRLIFGANDAPVSSWEYLVHRDPVPERR